MEEGPTPVKENPVVVETPDAPKKRERSEEDVYEPEIKISKVDEESGTPPTLPLSLSGELLPSSREVDGAYLSQEHADEPLPPFNARLAEEGMRFEEEKKRAAELSLNSSIALLITDLHLSVQSKTLFKKESLGSLFPQVSDNGEDLTKTLNNDAAFEDAFGECCQKGFFEPSVDGQYALIADPKTIIIIRERLDEDVRKRLAQLGCELLKMKNH